MFIIDAFIANFDRHGSNLAFEECNHALIRIVERIDFDKIKILLKSYNELLSK